MGGRDLRRGPLLSSLPARCASCRVSLQGLAGCCVSHRSLFLVPLLLAAVSTDRAAICCVIKITTNTAGATVTTQPSHFTPRSSGKQNPIPPTCCRSSAAGALWLPEADVHIFVAMTKCRPKASLSTKERLKRKEGAGRRRRREVRERGGSGEKEKKKKGDFKQPRSKNLS